MRYLVSILLMINVMMAMPKSEKNPTFFEGTTLGKYRKPGAPVDIRYKSEHLATGEQGRVEIELITPETDGVMQLKIHLDDGLVMAKSLPMDQKITLNGSLSYPLSFEVVVLKEGVHYIKLLVEMGKQGFRAFAIPVYVGNMRRSVMRKATTYHSGKVPLSISKAEETITQK